MIETKFKHTDIGLVPEDWSLFSVEEDVTVHARIGWQGLTTNEYKSHGIYKLVTSTDIENGAVNWNICHYVSEWRYKQDEKIILSDGDTLLSKDGTIGKVAFVKDIPSPSTLNSGVYVLRPKDESSLTKSYLALCFKSVYFKNFMERLSAGSTINHLYQKDIVGFTFPVPPADEQRRIASALMKVDALISTLDKLIAKKQAIKKGAMQELLTGKKRLPGFKGEWKEIRLGDVANVLRGGSPRPIENYITTKKDGINWIKIGDVSSDAKYIEHTKEKIKTSGVGSSRCVQVGDLILSNSMSYGRPNILKINGCIHDGWLVIQDYQETFNVDFLYYALDSTYVTNQYIAAAAGSSVKNLNKEKVAAVLIKSPTMITEQRAIAHVLSTMDSDISALETKRDKYRQIKQGMMRDLLTGRIRLTDKGSAECKGYSIELQESPFDGVLVAEPYPD